MNAKFPMTLKAMQQGEKVQWAIGDALIKECGPPGDDGVNTGSKAKLEQAREEAAKNGFEYSLEMLRKLRNTAAMFSAGKRLPAVGWAIHSIAGDPDMLDAIVKRVKGRKLTADLAYDLKYEINHPDEDKDDKRKRKRGKKGDGLPDLGPGNDEPPDGTGLSTESLRMSSFIEFMIEMEEILKDQKNDLDEEIFHEFMTGWARFKRFMDKLPQRRFKVIKGGVA